MKLKLFLILFLLITGAGTLVVKAQSMAITMLDGTEQTIGLSSLENVAFSTSMLMVNQISGASSSISLSAIRRIYFKEVPAAIDDVVLTEETISFFPNPVEDLICFRNVPDDTTIVKIYRMDGRMMSQSLVSSGNNSLDASSLPAGFYIVSINNQVLKFIKL